MRFKLLVLLMTSVFALPGLAGCSGKPVTAAVNEDALDYMYGIPMDKNAAVVADSVADVYSSPDVKSTRVTQVLYNQPVSVLQQDQGWAKVTTIDGSTGWIKVKYIDNDISSIHGRTYTQRIIVTSREKEITSTPSGGITHMNAPMGTEFFVFNSSGNAYEVYLPGNKTGWLKRSGVITVNPKEEIPVTNADDFAATASRLKGSSFLINGLSSKGIDSAGLVYICARINGINLPRNIAGLLVTGTEIKCEDAQIGDLVFISGLGEGEGENITGVGICTDGESYIYAGSKLGYVAIGHINEDNSEGRVVAVRRIFN